MTEPQPTTYSFVAVTVTAECPWCDHENDITTLGGMPDSEELHMCSQCFKMFTLIGERYG